MVTCLDGHEMAKQGRAGPALGIAALCSFAAGTFAIVALMLVAPTLAHVAIAFGPPEYFSLMVLGLTILSFLSRGSMAKSLLMAAFGVLLGLIGMDQITAQPRLTFGRLELLDGIGLVPIVMGLFGVAEILSNLEREIKREVIKARIGGLWPSRADWAASKWADRARHGARLLPRHPAGWRCGHRRLCQLRAGEERVEHTGALRKGSDRGRRRRPRPQTTPPPAGRFIPLLTLGIPPNVVMALLLGAFIMHGLQPGPLMMVQRPDMFWGIIASMYIGNAMLLVLNMPLIGMWVQVLKMPYQHPVPTHLDVLHRRRVRLWQRRVRRVRDGGVRRAWLPYAQVRIRARAISVGLRAGADAGEQPAQIADPVAGRLRYLSRATDLRGMPGVGRSRADRTPVARAGTPAQSCRHRPNVNRSGW